MTTERTATGRFAPGVSPNPGGRPRGGKHGPEGARAKRLALEHTVEAVQTIIDVMRNKEEQGKTRIYAAELLLNRALGKPETEKQDDAPEAVSHLQPEQADRVWNLLNSGALTTPGRAQ